MTREEAIALMKSAQLMLVNPTTNEPVSDLYEALDMAIKALEQEPCDDCVSRQALLRKLNTKTHEYSNGMGFRKEWVELINSLSPVTPKREQGEWIPLGNYDDYGQESSYKCSECGEINTYPDNFCFNCGAEMR